jgi:hypothetical protein
MTTYYITKNAVDDCEIEIWSKSHSGRKFIWALLHIDFFIEEEFGQVVNDLNPGESMEMKVKLKPIK